MKALLILLFFSLGFTSAETEKALSLQGSWQLIRYKYNNDAAFIDCQANGVVGIKMFTATRWAASSYNSKDKKINGTAGGTYTLSGDQYSEKVDYYSWDAATEGRTFHFTMTIENGMLHQVGYMEYKGNNHYLIDEWYRRID